MVGSRFTPATILLFELELLELGIARQPRKVVSKNLCRYREHNNGIFLIGCGGVKVLTYSEQPTNNRFLLPLT
jgi:hypothetical protein